VNEIFVPTFFILWKRAFILFFYSTYTSNREYSKMVNFERCNVTPTVSGGIQIFKNRF